MRDLEARFKQSSGLANRGSYKIFYSQIKPAGILTLGINPGGNPAQMCANGLINLDCSIASSSSGFFEGDEHDILDCEWPENTGLRRFLIPFRDGDAS